MKPEFLLLFLLVVNCLSDDCLQLSTCGTCIRNPSCGWCQAPKDNKTNCKSTTSNETWCEENEMIDRSPTFNIITDEPLSSKGNSQYVQIKPQKVSLKIVENQEYELDLKFAKAENPLDVYILLDASNTMKPYKEILQSIGGELSEAILKLTKDFRLGFGSFVDKTVYPFDFMPDHVPKCNNNICERGYSFKNHLKLVNDPDEFNNQVKKLNITSNLDQPEGGLEALMQAIVCKDEIGWRPDATKLIILATDDVFHIAGDGRLAGIVDPNDGLCHMKDNQYIKDKEIDYPSVSHLSYTAETNNVHIIFAIATDPIQSDANNKSISVETQYKELQKNIALSAFGSLTKDKSEIIKLVIGTYLNIVSKIKITHNFMRDAIHVETKVKCYRSQEFVNDDKCSEVKVAEEHEFKIKIKPTECLKQQHFAIQVEGVSEKLIVDLKVVCECDCETAPDPPSKDECSGHGVKKCGICKCDPGYTGVKCECSKDDYTSGELNCLNPDTNQTCSGNGACVCGVCSCDQGYYEKFCSCSDTSCPKSNGMFCSGHGVCKCNKCNCYSEYTEKDCSCPTSDRDCIAPYSDKSVCNGNGNCNCGKCKCEKGYYGSYCESCTDCEWCKDLNPCVEAYISDKTVDESSLERINCSSVNIIPLENATSSIHDDQWTKCLLPGIAGCTTAYKYKLVDDFHFVVEIGEKRCAFIASVGGILLVTLLPLLIGGLVALLAWKAIVTVKDQKEYAKFMKMKQQQQWNVEMNPLFKSAQTNYENPTFKKQA